MKSIKTLFVSFILFTIAVPAFAGQWGDTATGGVIGAIAGRGICNNCSSRNKNIATGAMAIGGALLGNSIGSRSDRQADMQQQRISQQGQQQGQWQEVSSQPVGGSFSRTVRSVDVSQQQPTTWITDDQPQPVVRRVAVMPSREIIERRPVSVQQDVECDEEYYHGQFNPEAAHAYCKGRRDSAKIRERQIREAYQEGLASQ